MPSSAIEKEIESRLGQRGVRFTRGRRLIVQELASSEGPVSAAELNETISHSVPLSSIYRTLSVLENAGVVVPHFGAKGVTRFELAEWITGHHHHLVCLACGSIDDIDVPSPQESNVHQLVDSIAALAQFRPTGHALEIEGTCRRCS